MEKYKLIEQSIIKKFRPQIWRMFVRAIDEYKLIEDGDRIAICISGGKDSMLLAKCMEEFQKHGPIKFEVVYLCMNPGYSEYHFNKLLENAKILNLNLDVFNSDIFDIVHDIKDSPCYLCARMRRGYLYMSDHFAVNGFSAAQIPDIGCAGDIYPARDLVGSGETAGGTDFAG